jgi:hypothetical protein
VKLIKINGSELKVRLSPSFIQNAACPAYLKFRYVDRTRERFIKVAAERGKAAHGAIAEVLEYCMETKTPLADVEDGMLREVLEKHIPHTIIAETGLIFQWVRLWRDRFKVPSNIHGIEDKIAIDDEYEECAWEDASYRGILDLNQITGSHCIITDWKSQPHIVPQSELDQPLGSDVAEQMTHYAWLAWKMYPHIKTFSVRIWYLRYGFYMETSRSEEDLEAFENALMIKERKIAELDNWDPIPGTHCQYCDYKNECPIAQDLSPGNPEVITQEQAIIAAQRITVMEAIIKERKEKLKAYVNHNDEVMIGDNWTYGYRHRESITWDPGEAESVLRDHNRDLSEVANVDVKKMKKLMKEAAKDDPQLEGALDDIKKSKHSTEFKGYRRGSEED